MHAISRDTIFVGEKKKRALEKIPSLRHPDIRKQFFTWHILKDSSYFRSKTATTGPGPPHYRDSQSHSHTPHAVRLLWTSDQLVADTST